MKHLLTAALILAASYASAEGDKLEILTKPPMISEGTFPDEINLEGAANLEGLEVDMPMIAAVPIG